MGCQYSFIFLKLIPFFPFKIVFNLSISKFEGCNKQKNDYFMWCKFVKSYNLIALINALFQMHNSRDFHQMLLSYSSPTTLIKSGDIHSPPHTLYQTLQTTRNSMFLTDNHELYIFISNLEGCDAKQDIKGQKFVSGGVSNLQYIVLL